MPAARRWTDLTLISGPLPARNFGRALRPSGVSTVSSRLPRNDIMPEHLVARLPGLIGMWLRKSHDFTARFFALPNHTTRAAGSLGMFDLVAINRQGFGSFR
jgi:hypothetical protein